MSSLETLKKTILSDGKIDASEIAEIRKTIYEDGKIDTAEADFLFDLNNGCSGSDNDPAWATFFADAICSFLLDDENSPGEVDQKEADWLIDKIQGDGKLDDTEKTLLRNIAKKAKSIPNNLQIYIDKNV